MRARQIGLVLAVAGGAALGLSGCGSAALLVVDTVVDGVDAAPGDGVCEMTTGVGDCSLRAAIDEANALASDTDVITVEPGLGPIVLTADGSGEDANATGDLDITDSVIVVGNGATIDASGLATGDRVLHVHPGVQATFLGAEVTSIEPPAGSGAAVTTTITGGDVAGDGGGILNAGTLDAEHLAVTANDATLRGGGIRSTGPLELTDVSVTANTGLYGGGIDKGSSLLLTDSTVSGNDSARHGGGIYSKGPLSITGSTISGNVTRWDGGGVWTNGVADIVDSTISDNTSRGGDGGGIYDLNQLQVTRSAVTGNTVPDSYVHHGGGIASSGDAQVSDTTISGNRAGGEGGGVYVRSGGTVGIDRSTIAGNDATEHGSAVGVDDGELTLTRTTVTGNTAGTSPSPSAIYASQADDWTIDIAASTIVDNDGIGLDVDNNIDRPLALLATVVSGHPLGDCDLQSSNPPSSFGFNVDGDGTCARDATDQTVADPGLGALTDNGGLTATRLPSAGSALLDQIPVGTPGLCDGTFPLDQRSLARPSGSACDIGAVERQPGDT